MPLSSALGAPLFMSVLSSCPQLFLGLRVRHPSIDPLIIDPRHCHYVSVGLLESSGTANDVGYKCKTSPEQELISDDTPRSRVCIPTFRSTGTCCSKRDLLRIYTVPTPRLRDSATPRLRVLVGDTTFPIFWPDVLVVATTPFDPCIPGHAGMADYHRKRLAVACDICRERRTRCDGRRPKCSFCEARGCDCVYRSAPEAPPSRYKLSGYSGWPHVDVIC